MNSVVDGEMGRFSSLLHHTGMGTRVDPPIPPIKRDHEKGEDTGSQNSWQDLDHRRQTLTRAAMALMAKHVTSGFAKGSDERFASRYLVLISSRTPWYDEKQRTPCHILNLGPFPALPSEECRVPDADDCSWCRCPGREVSRPETSRRNGQVIAGRSQYLDLTGGGEDIHGVVVLPVDSW